MRSSAKLDLHDPEPFSGRVFDAHLDSEFGRKQKPTAAVSTHFAAYRFDHPSRRRLCSITALPTTRRTRRPLMSTGMRHGTRANQT